jgi:hypothetical protein
MLTALMKVRKGGVYTFRACGWDRFDRKPNTPADGIRVRVCTPHGCPPPNNMANPTEPARAGAGHRQLVRGQATRQQPGARCLRAGLGEFGA